MRVLVTLLMLWLAACSSSGPEACRAAGGECVPGGRMCPNRGSQDCNPDRNPGGFFCCLPCPSGKAANDAGTACE